MFESLISNWNEEEEFQEAQEYEPTMTEITDNQQLIDVSFEPKLSIYLKNQSKYYFETKEDFVSIIQ